MQLKSLTYTSWAKPGVDDGDVDDIIRSARINNPLDGITGLLIFNGGAFLQIIEGAENAIDDLVAKLRRDPRHSEFRVRDERIVEVRAFPDWSMGLLRIRSGRFEGRAAVDRALARDVPPPIRNLILAMVLSIGDEDR